MALPLIQMPAYAHGGPFTKGQPTVVVTHCTESDNTPAMAEALAGPNWFGGSKAGTSAHKVVDVDSICEGVKRTIVAYHAGPGGNIRGIAYEFCGRASWSAAKWREPAQLQMLRNAAPHIADDLRATGGAARWLSLAQLGAGQRGMCTHNDIRLVFGGTTHSDPGPNFPYAELLSYVVAELTGNPIQEDDMPYSENDIRRLVREAVFDQQIPFRYRDETAPEGYRDSAINVGPMLQDLYTQQFWGIGGTNWGPGVVQQLSAIRSLLEEIAKQSDGISEERLRQILAESVIHVDVDVTGGPTDAD